MESPQSFQKGILLETLVQEEPYQTFDLQNWKINQSEGDENKMQLHLGSFRGREIESISINLLLKIKSGEHVALAGKYNQ